MVRSFEDVMPNAPEGNKVTGNKQNILFGMVRSSEDVMPNAPEGSKVTGNKQNVLFEMVRSSEDVMWILVWQADLKKKKRRKRSYMQSSHQVECICQCATA